jgi:prevent-host-death family protein
MLKTVTVAEAKAQFSALIDLAREGSEIVITRHGKEVARLAPPIKKNVAPDLAMLRQVQARLPGWSEPSAKILAKLRAEE